MIQSKTYNNASVINAFILYHQPAALPTASAPDSILCPYCAKFLAMKTMTHTTPQTFAIHSLEELSQWAELWAEDLKPGDIVGLHGPMGAGKTTLTQALSRALGITERVNSPTFVLIHEYETGKFPVIHADLYRLGPEQADGLLDELSPAIELGKALVLVEWIGESDAISALANWHVTLASGDELNNPEKRIITVVSPEGRLKILSSWKSVSV